MGFLTPYEPLFNGMFFHRKVRIFHKECTIDHQGREKTPNSFQGKNQLKAGYKQSV